MTACRRHSISIAEQKGTDNQTSKRSKYLAASNLDYSSSSNSGGNS